MLEPNVEYWSQGADEMEHLSRCARVCYGKDVAAREPMKMAQRLADDGHLSMFRHVTYYYMVPFEVFKKYHDFQEKCHHSPYVGYNCNKPERRVYLAVNGQFWLEHNVDFHPFEKYIATEADFMRSWNTAWLVRYTFCMTTQISTTRELNRTSPNNIAEQSTRYVDMLPRMDDVICRPHWLASLPPFKRWVARQMFRWEARFYGWARNWLGLKAQDAREYLPLCTQSRVCYTYSAAEWARIINLRYLQVTGPAHPHAVALIKQVHDYLSARGYDIVAHSRRKYDLSAMIPSDHNKDTEK